MNVTPSAPARAYFSDAVTLVTDIKTTQGVLWLLNLMNGVAATSYLQVFFKPASAVVLGSTAPDFVIKLPTNGGSGFTQTLAFPVPVGSFGTGLSIAGTTTPTGSTAAAIGVSAVYS